MCVKGGEGGGGGGKGNPHGSMKEMVGGCCVCSDERGWAENPLVYCDGHGCNVAVHQGRSAAPHRARGAERGGGVRGGGEAGAAASPAGSPGGRGSGGEGGGERGGGLCFLPIVPNNGVADGPPPPRSRAGGAEPTVSCAPGLGAGMGGARSVRGSARYREPTAAAGRFLPRGAGGGGKGDPHGREGRSGMGGGLGRAPRRGGGGSDPPPLRAPRPRMAPCNPAGAAAGPAAAASSEGREEAALLLPEISAICILNDSEHAPNTRDGTGKFVLRASPRK